MSYKYYELLGLKKENNPSQRDIKNAYHKVAMANHPDKNPNNKKCEELFKQISNAYSILSDENKKRDYDRLGDNNYQENGNNGGGGGMSHDDIFAHFFGNRNHQERFRRGGGSPFSDFGFNFDTGGNGRRNNCENINKNITVNLNDVYKGINTEIKIQIKKHCLKCIKKCENCNGSGTVKQIRNMGILTQISESTCNICKGRGEIHNKNKNCNECKGNGSYIKEEKTKLIVNPGFPDKYKKVFKGFGEQPTTNNQKAGDLILEINIDKNHVLKREGNNLYYSIEVDFIDSVIGKDINIPYFDNSININTSTFGVLLHGKKYMLEGKGLPIFNNENKFGNMFVDFSIKQCKIKNNNKLNELKILLNEMIN